MQTVVSFGTRPRVAWRRDLHGVQRRRRGVEPVQPVAAGGLHACFRLWRSGDGEPGGSTQFVLQENTAAVGTFTGTVTFTTNDSVEKIFSFPVTGTVSPMVINDGGAGWATTTGTWTLWTGQGYAGDDHEAAVQQHGHVDLQRFDGGELPGLRHVAGQQEPGHQRSVHGHRRGGSVTNVLVNQQNAPPTSIGGSGPAGGAWSWQPAWGHVVHGWSQRHAGGGSLQRRRATACVEADAVMLVRT